MVRMRHWETTWGVTTTTATTITANDTKIWWVINKFLNQIKTLVAIVLNVFIVVVVRFALFLLLEWHSMKYYCLFITLYWIFCCLIVCLFTLALKKRKILRKLEFVFLVSFRFYLFVLFLLLLVYFSIVN